MTTSNSSTPFSPRGPHLVREAPAELLRLAYTYCEELTRREAGNSITVHLLRTSGKPCVCVCFRRRADDIADGDWSDRFPGSPWRWIPAKPTARPSSSISTPRRSGRGGLPEQNHATLFRKNRSSCYNEAWSTDPVFLALKDTVQRFTILASSSMTYSGMEDDLYQNRYRTFDDLYVYCYRVASVVV